MKLQLAYIAKPYYQTQEWGVYRPEVYSRFGFTEHNGEDVRLGDDNKIYAPTAMRITQIGNTPSGAGIFVSGITLTQFDEWYASQPKPYYVYLTFMHLKSVTVKVGDIVDVGDELGVADNTGFSTGPHTHIFAGRVKEQDGKYVFVDELLHAANYSFDHTKYYTGQYAQDIKAARIQAELDKLTYIAYEVELTALQKLLELLKQLIKVVFSEQEK